MRSDFEPTRIREAKETLSRQLRVVEEEIARKEHERKFSPKRTLWQRILMVFRKLL